MINLQIIHCTEFIFKGKNYENSIVVFVYEESLKKRLVDVTELISLINIKAERIFIYPCFSKRWIISDAVIKASIEIAKQLKKKFTNVSIIYPTFTRNFILTPNSSRYLLLEASLNIS
ncbi:MAG: hypothetical protein DRJ44_01190 [Thermoprotei archaeon]|nr:MAG: hypothetical protein DRJ44_01190 [Thermoprotei archaeon]